jgi:hypothetical protein
MGIRTPDLLHAIGTLLGSLAAACPAEAAAAIGPAPAAACSGPKTAADCGTRFPASSASANAAVMGIRHAVQARDVTPGAAGSRRGRRSDDGQMIFPACSAKLGNDHLSRYLAHREKKFEPHTSCVHSGHRGCSVGDHVAASMPARVLGPVHYTSSPSAVATTPSAVATTPSAVVAPLSTAAAALGTPA